MTPRTIEAFGPHESMVAIDICRAALEQTYGYQTQTYERELTVAGLTVKVRVVVGFEDEGEGKR